MYNEIKSDYILKWIFNILYEKTILKIIKNNNALRKRLNISLKAYKKIHNQIEIEIIPIEKENLLKEENIFINYNIKDKSYYHIYINNNDVKEIKRNYIKKEDNVNKIKIIIEDKIKTFKELFKRCYCLKEFSIIKFYRSDIRDMSFLFCGCSSLIKLNILKLDTRNVINMSGMF